MTSSLQNEIIDLLKTVPVGKSTLIDAELLSGLSIENETILCSLEFPHLLLSESEETRQKVEQLLEKTYPSYQIRIMVTAKKEAPKLQTKPKGEPLHFPNIKSIIAISSAKGGVGKSTVASNLAVQAARSGLKVGLLDADIYGPSVPTTMGISGEITLNDQKKIIPHKAHNVTVMSIGFMIDPNKAMIWRGPMAQSALVQLLRDVDWGELDVLFIDMPPGTGDIQLTLAQKEVLDGAILVSTPQDIALIDTRKGLAMFQKMNVPVLGLIENMSYHICSNCGHEEDIFGHGGAKQDAEKYGIPFLGAIPLNKDIRLATDQGKPICLSNQAIEQTYSDIVNQLKR